MSQFDQTTERIFNGEDGCAKSARIGRKSTKASMEVLARTMERVAERSFYFKQEAQNAIAQVKANGDWPLGEE